MSDPVAEISLLAADFRSRLKSAYQQGGADYPRKVVFLGSFSDGSRYMVENGVRGISYYLVTDLKSVLGQRGSTTITVGANSLVSSRVVALPSPLDNVNNWLAYATIVEGAITEPLFAAVKLTVTTTLTVYIFRNPNMVTFAGTTETAIPITGNTSYEQIVGANHQHVVDDGITFPEASGHAHNLDGSAQGNLSTNLPLETYTVNWLLVHV